MKYILFVLLVIYSSQLYAQKDSLSKIKEQLTIPVVKYNLDSTGKSYLQLQALSQFWFRMGELNPESQINNIPESTLADFGIRRTRFQLLAQLNSKIFFYSQLGINSFSFMSERKLGFFLHDITGEIEFIPKRLTIGMGLHGWVGPLRFSSPSVGSILGLDSPLFQQTTNDINDQFVRRLGVFVKGYLGRLNYRFSIGKPFLVNNVNSSNIPGSQANVPQLNSMGLDVSTYSTKNPKLQINSYLMFHFKDIETNKIPYHTGSYLGTKTLFNIGAGIQYQPDALWKKQFNSNNNSIDTIAQDLCIIGVDLIWEKKLVHSDDMLHIYAAWMYSNYGSNYVRNFAPMNPSDPGSGYYNTSSNFRSGKGFAFPMNGTGNTLYMQVGYKFKKDLLNSYGTIMPYIMLQYSKFDAIGKGFLVYDVGINWLWIGHKVKTSINYQNRPFLSQNSPTEDIHVELRKSLFVMQWQFAF